MSSVIATRVRPLALLALLALAAPACRPPAAPAYPPAGLEVVSSLAEHRRAVEAAPELELVDLAAAVPGARLEVRYATADNFLGRPLYPVARAFLRRPAAEALAAVQRELAVEGLALKVWDAYRPYAVTVAMWEAVGNPDYVADPARGSRHNRGCAVDVTLVRAAIGEEVPMPTAHDDFTPLAAADATGLPPEAAANRNRLRAAMERHGFVVLPSEWWHFDFAGWERFPLLDLPLEVLTGPAAAE
jgi:D-alanyl-D-alanine dipeptidase